MPDDQPFGLDPTEGYRAPTTSGERVVVALAGLALIGGLLIATGNLIGSDEDEREAAQAEEPTAEPTRTPRPSPTLRVPRVVALEPGVPEQQPSPVPYFYGWVRPYADLTVWSRPAAEGTQLGVLAAGEVAVAESRPEQQSGSDEWLYVQRPPTVGADGWIRTRDGGTELIERYAQPAGPFGGDIWSVTAGPNEFVAKGWGPITAGELYGGQPLTIASDEGASWSISSRDSGSWTSPAAWGPAGWITVGAADDPLSTAWVWNSPDGQEWNPLGSLPSEVGLPGDLVASERGYLLMTSPRSASRPALWHSRDAVTWHESTDPDFGGDLWLQVAAVPQGYLAWPGATGYGGPPDAGIAFSPDGRTWTTFSGGPQPPIRVAAVGEPLIAFDADPVTGTPQAWIGTIHEDRLSWVRDEASNSAFLGTSLSALASDGERAVAFGWDRETEAPLLWNWDSDGWAPATLPSELGGIPRFAAGGAAGFVVVGYQATSRGLSPIFWHESDTGSWEPEATPVLPAPADPSPDTCPAVPADALKWAILDRAAAVVCFGSRPMTFRAWSAPCDGCYGGGTGLEPAWLAAPSANQLYLSPVENNDGLWTNAVLHPDLVPDPAWTGTWIEVTGHFDHPDALGCRWTPSREEAQWFTGSEGAVIACRQQFVVTAVTPVGAP